MHWHRQREVTAVNKKISDFLFKNKVVILFLLLCVGATAASKQPLTFVIPELFTRIARNAFIVLALIIPVITGLGLNFGIVVGAMAAQIALFLTTYWGFYGSWRLFHYRCPGYPYCAGVRLPGRKTLQPGKGK